MKFSGAELNRKIVDFFKPYDPVKIGLFGSYVRGEQHEESDLDIIYTIRKPITLFDLVGMEKQLSDALGVKVDLVSERSITNERLKNHISKDLQIIYE